MIITCPRCSTRYVIDPGVLVPNGRPVGCTHCGHHWTQTPPAPAPSTGDAVPQSESAETASAPDETSPGAEREADEGPTAEPGGDSQPPAPPGEGLAPRPRDTAAPEPAASPAAVDGPAEQPSSSEPAGAEKLTEAEGSPETDPIPAALTKGRSPVERGRPNWKKKPSMAALAGIGAFAALMVIALVLVVARGPIVSAVPGTAGLYRGVGLLGDEIGAGLEIRDVRSARRRDGADEILTIEGMVANVTDEPLDLPVIRVSLSGGEGEELQFVTVPPDIAALPPGETVAFEARMLNPSALVRRVKVKFTPSIGSSSQEGGGDH